MNRLLKYVVFCIMVLLAQQVCATHNRAGEITFEQVKGFTYRITITTFTYTLSPADRSYLEVDWGDRSSSTVVRRGILNLPDYYRMNVYDTIHTFPGPGVYEVVVQDPNRNFGVVNIPNSVNVVFAISTTILVSPQLEQNSTPVLLSMPIDKAARGHIFVHNPVAFDIDGDSVSYKLSTCRGENGEPIESYTLPEASNQPLYIDSRHGNLVWDSPVDTGIYNIALDIEEWRNGIKIGKILRDMQISVYNTTNNPPVNMAITDHCVTAGDTVVFEVTSIDEDLDKMYHEFIGGPFLLNNPPEVEKLIDTNGVRSSRFTWVTDCSHIRRLPFDLILKTTDINGDVTLVDIDNFSIQVIGKSPKNLLAEASNTTINLSWDAQECERITGYQIYRRIGEDELVIDSCQMGINPESGFELVGEVSGSNTNKFTDDNNGTGLAQGLHYCYVIAAIYRDGALSRVSNQTCALLKSGAPPLTNTSVEVIDETNGQVSLSWIRLRHLDTIPALGPYEVAIYRSDDLNGNNFSLIHSYQANDLSDTSYIDMALNTTVYPYSYQVEIYNNEAGNRFLIGTPEVASTLYPEIIPGDNNLRLDFVKDVPWLNHQYIIYRLNTNTKNYDSIGYSEVDSYVDSNLNNGTEYCYRVKSSGWRIYDSVRFYNENWSHINCGVPIDTFPPCPPDLSVTTFCDSLGNLLEWNDLNNTCANDVVLYKVFFSPTLDGEMSQIAQINDPGQLSYFHIPELGPAGCYAVSAVDSFDNESNRSLKICVDECSGYELPNVFTPNNDRFNDVYMAINPNGYVKKVEMKIFNRWGTLVYETDDPDINWDGRAMQNNKTVSSGVYFYTCTVYENRIVGAVSRNLSGFIHVYTGPGENGVFIE